MLKLNFLYFKNILDNFRVLTPEALPRKVKYRSPSTYVHKAWISKKKKMNSFKWLTFFFMEHFHS